MSSFKNGGRKWLKKTGLFFSASFVLLTGLIGSASAYVMCDPCMSDPCSYPYGYCCEMPSYYLYAEYIYWQFNPDGTQFARCGVSNPVDVAGGDTQNTFSEEGCTFATDCHYTSGFKVGGLIDLGCCDWDFYAEYTWLNPDFVKNIPDNTVSNLISTFIIDETDLFGPTLDSAKAKFCDSFNVLDFGLGRTFNVCGCFLFRPHFGFKATWQNIKYNLTYGFVDDQDNPVYDYSLISKNEIDFNGIGLRTGFDLAWEFSPCFSIVGEFAVSTVYSDLKIKRKDTLTVTPYSGGTELTFTPVWTRFDQCTLIPVLEFFMGVRWDSNVCNCYDVFVRIGWENQVWVNFNRFLTAGPDTVSDVHGNLALQGLTVGAGIGF